MKKILFIQKGTPYKSIGSQEGLEMLLLTSSFNFQITLLFMGDGLWQLTKNQNGERIGRKNLGAMLQSLPAFDVTSIFAEARALKERNLAINDLALPITPIDGSDISTLMRNHELIINF